MRRTRTDPARGAGEPSNWWALAALGLGAFVVGTAELLIVGVLNLVAQDLGVSISTAGELVTGYALGISIGGPLLSAATIRLDRRLLLWLSLLIYLAGNVLTLASTSFGMLLASRILTGSVHGLFIGVAFAVAAGLVPRQRQGRAVAVVIGGITVAIVVGVPLGTLIGQTLGWRAAFVAVVMLAAVALAAAVLLVPRVAARGAGNFAAQAHAAFAPRVLAMLGVGLLLMGGQFTAFTYLQPYLEGVTRISGGAVSGFLLVYGIAAAAGTLLGGRAADRNATVTLVAANALLLLALGLLYLLGSAPVAVAVVLAGWAIVGLGLVPALQLRVISLAGKGADLAATLGVSAVNAGIAAGSLLGGAVIAGSGVHSVVLAALLVCALALPATWATGRLVPLRRAQESPPVPETARAPAIPEAKAR
jgi:MFS transporter, DHA1 family, inner membrane transport protein